MKRILPNLFSLVVLAFCASSVSADQTKFLYTNNNPRGVNTVSAFRPDASGDLQEIVGSPFATGGLGDGDGFFAATRIITVEKFLFASNSGSGSISAFRVDKETGALTAVPGSPFPTDFPSAAGISIAAARDGEFLFAGAGNALFSNLRVFRIGEEGELTPVGPPVPLPPGLNAMKVTPDGDFLAAILTFTGPHGPVAILSIDEETGALTALTGSPFSVRPAGGPVARATGLDINCAGDSFFVAEGTAGTTVVDVLTFDARAETLTPIPGSPFTPGVGVNSNVPFLSPDDTVLWVSNQFSNTITAFQVAEDGTLNLLTLA